MSQALYGTYTFHKNALFLQRLCSDFTPTYHILNLNKGICALANCVNVILN